MIVLRAFKVAMAGFVFLTASFPHANAQEPWKEARFFDAVASGNKNAVEEALAAGHSPNAIGPGFGGVLTWAVVRKQLDIVKLLLAHGANVKAKGNENLVSAAIRTGRLDILQCIADAGADVTGPQEACYRDDVLVDAVSTENRDMLRYLLQRGANPNGTTDQCNESALQAAAMEGDVEAMKMLLDAGANINYRDCNGMSALMIACQYGHQEAVELLVARGADASFKNGYDRTAETFASQLKGENAEKLRVLCAGKKN